MNHRSFVSLGRRVTEFFQIYFFERSSFKLRCETVGIALCYSHRACCLLHYFCKINNGIHIYQFTFELLHFCFRNSDYLNTNIGGSPDFAKTRNKSADLHTLYPLFTPLPLPQVKLFLNFTSIAFHCHSFINTLFTTSILSFYQFQLKYMFIATQVFSKYFFFQITLTNQAPGLFAQKLTATRVAVELLTNTLLLVQVEMYSIKWLARFETETLPKERF